MLTITETANAINETYPTITTADRAYTTAGELFPKLNTFPAELRLNLDGDIATIYAIKRGNFIAKDGRKKPSIHCLQDSSQPFLIHDVDIPEGAHKYFTCINFNESKNGCSVANNYKFYEMTYDKDKGVIARYGRIGEKDGKWAPRTVQDPYPDYFWYVLQEEKLSKGYVDQTKIRDGDKVKKTEKKAVKERNKVADELFKKLAGFSRDYINSISTKRDFIATKAQIRKAKSYLKQLQTRKTVNGFNSVLGKLMSIVPRHMRYVSMNTARSTNDFQNIIDREKSLIDAMEGTEIAGTATSFREKGVYVHLAKDWQKDHVLRNLDPSLTSHVTNIYHISYDDAHKANFEEYCDTTKANVKTLWHGTGNENVLSILCNGLTTHPVGVDKTGSMLGEGIYFAIGKDGSIKSNGYNSHRGSYWKGGRDDTSYLLLCKIAYKPLMVTTNGGIRDYDEAEMKQNGTTCVHATNQSWLRHDEICLYNEKGVIVTDLVELKS